MANFVKLIVLISSFVIIFPASSLAQQTKPSPKTKMTVLPKAPITLIIDEPSEPVPDPTGFEVSVSKPLILDKVDSLTKPNHRTLRFTDNIKAKNTVESSVISSGYSSIDSVGKKD